MPTKERAIKDVSMEEISKILYGEESEDNYESDAPQVESKQPESRLLKQKGLEFTLEKVPYYKRPIVQMGFILLVGFPVIWLLISIFNPGSNAQPKKVEDNPLEKENEQLQASLTEARDKIDEMTFEKGLKTQEIELIKPLEEVEEEPEKEPEEAPKIAKVQQPVPPRTVSRPVVYRQARTTPTFTRPIEPKVIKEPEPEIDPMEQWLAQAQRGYAVSSLEKVPYRSIASSHDESGTSGATVDALKDTASHKVSSSKESAPKGFPSVSSRQPSQNSDVSKTVVPREQYQVASSNTRIQKEPQNIPVNSQEPPPITEIAAVEPMTERAVPPRKQGRLFDRSYLEKVQQQETLWNDDEFKARLQRGSSYLANRNRTKLVARRQPVPPKTREVIQAKPVEAIAPKKQRETRSNHQNKILDIGSQAKAELSDGIAWTDEESGTRRKYILQLKEGFENSAGREILPKGTKLIARITNLSRSGLFYMEVTHVMTSLDEPKIAVPPGTLEIIASDGSPLKAKLKQKGGGSSFLGDVGSIIAPGVEKALDTADNLIVNGDAISVSRRNRDPLRSGLSGMAGGLSDALENSLRNGDRSRAASYFQFDGNQTVRIVVNEDFYLP